MRVIGPDVSFYQDNPETASGIDFVQMAVKTPFVIIRAGQNLWVDNEFNISWNTAKLAGLARGSYWFYDSRADPKRQAELWIETLGDDLGELPLFADFEDRYKGPFTGWKHWYNFLERLKQLVPGKEICIYTGYYYWIENTTSVGIPIQSLNYFRQYPLWIANYNDIDAPIVPLPWGVQEWLFWQYTENGAGHEYGAESHRIDLNYFNGDLDAFRARFKLGDVKPPKAGISFSVMYGDMLVKYKEKSNG